MIHKWGDKLDIAGWALYFGMDHLQKQGSNTHMIFCTLHIINTKNLTILAISVESPENICNNETSKSCSSQWFALNDGVFTNLVSSKQKFQFLVHNLLSEGNENLGFSVHFESG